MLIRRLASTVDTDTGAVWLELRCLRSLVSPPSETHAPVSSDVALSFPRSVTQNMSQHGPSPRCGPTNHIVSAVEAPSVVLDYPGNFAVGWRDNSRSM